MECLENFSIPQLLDLIREITEIIEIKEMQNSGLLEALIMDK